MLKTNTALNWAVTFALLTPLAQAQRPSPVAAPHWVATWTAAQQLPRPPGPGRGAPPPAATATTATPAAPIAPPVVRPPSSFSNQTVRMVARASIGGSRLRVHLSNAFGSTPLLIGAAHAG